MTRLPFGAQLATLGTFVPEYRFLADRRFRFDWADVILGIAIEIDGGTWTGGRHVTGSGYGRDMEKFNESAILGWCVLHVTPQQVEDGTAFGIVERAVAARRT